jgi:hypothetical protein
MMKIATQKKSPITQREARNYSTNGWKSNNKSTTKIVEIPKSSQRTILPKIRDIFVLSQQKHIKNVELEFCVQNGHNIPVL